MENTQADCTALRPRTVAAIRAEMPEEELLYGLSDFFKVMGDPTRINILWALEKESLCVSDLAVLLDMTKSAVSHPVEDSAYSQAGAGGQKRKKRLLCLKRRSCPHHLGKGAGACPRIAAVSPFACGSIP